MRGKRGSPELVSGLALAWLVALIVTASAWASEETAAAGRLKAAAAAVRQVIAHRGSSADRPECTLSALRRAIEVGATASEVDVRTTRDRRLVILHDETLDRTTNGKGKIGQATLAEVRRLDAGSWFDARYKDQRVPTLREVLELGRGRIDVLLDLKEQGDAYDRQVVAEIKKYGDPRRIIIGVRSVEQAKRFRGLLPEARQLGLIPRPESIGAFVKAGVETIRLWPRWVRKDPRLVETVHRLKAGLHLNGTTGARAEVAGLLAHRPTSLSSDDPGRLVRTLEKLSGKKLSRKKLSGGKQPTGKPSRPGN